MIQKKRPEVFFQNSFGSFFVIIHMTFLSYKLLTLRHKCHNIKPLCVLAITKKLKIGAKSGLKKKNPRKYEGFHTHGGLSGNEIYITSVRFYFHLFLKNAVNTAFSSVQ